MSTIKKKHLPSYPVWLSGCGFESRCIFTLNAYHLSFVKGGRWETFQKWTLRRDRKELTSWEGIPKRGNCKTGDENPGSLLKLTFLHACFLSFLNCAKGIKSSKTSHMGQDIQEI